MDERIPQLFLDAGIEPDDETWGFFEALRESVLRGNERMNLTRITEPYDFYRKHVLDSLLPFAAVPALAALRGPARAADLGSGAGFPGLVLAWACPDWRMALIERTGKKAAFLEETARALGLDNVTVHTADAREANDLRGACEVVTARAVGRIAAVCAAAAPLLAPRATLVHYKGGEVRLDELAAGERAAAKLRWKQEGPFDYGLPPDTGRSVVLSRTSGRKRAARDRPNRARR